MGGLLIIVGVVAVTLAGFVCVMYMFDRKEEAVEISTKRIEILRIYRRGYQAYSILSLADNNEVIEYWCSPHGEGTKLFVDSTDENPPHVILRTLNGQDSSSGAEIHVRSLDDILFDPTCR